MYVDNEASTTSQVSEFSSEDLDWDIPHKLRDPIRDVSVSKDKVELLGSSLNQ